MTVQERLQALRAAVDARRAQAREGQRRGRGGAGPQPPRWLLWTMFALTSLALFSNLLLAFNGSIFSAVFAVWTAFIVAQIWRTLGGTGALGDR
jgi:hypothetical protein